MSARSHGINLLPQSEFEVSFVGRFLHWAITSGRYIIILVEAIVIIAFLSRFKLDQELSDLSASIEGEKRIIASQSEQEKGFREIQKKLDVAQTMLNSQMKLSEQLDGLLATLPQEVKLESLFIRTSDISLAGTTNSETALGQMLLAMGKNPNWKELNLTNLSTENGSVISFSLVIPK